MWAVAALVEDLFTVCCLASLAIALPEGTFARFLRLPFALIILGALGYIMFWISWANWPAGQIFRAAFGVSAIVHLCIMLGRRKFDADIVGPLALLFVATFAITLLGHLGAENSHPLHVAANRWYGPLPMDNELPFMFEQAIKAGHVPIPLGGDWLSSDRPPLQVGMNLLLGIAPIGSPEVVYQVTSIALQCTCLLGVWYLARCYKASNYTAALAVAAVFFTPLFFVNAVFVWPKLLAAGLLLIAFGLHFREESNRRDNIGFGAAVGLAAGLSMVAHGTTGFVIIGLSIVALGLRRFGSWNYLLASLIGFLAPVLSWSAYQRFIDPPGTRLMKWHLAGVVVPDKRTLLQALTDAYGALSPIAWLEGRYYNLKIFFFGLDSYFYHKSLKAIYADHFYYLIVACGVFGLAFFVSPLFLISKDFRSATLSLFSCLAVWAILMFLPYNTIVHQGSFFPELLLITLAVLVTMKYFPRALLPLVAIAACWTSALYAVPLL